MEEKKMRREKGGRGGSEVVASNQIQSSRLIRSFTKPSWLLSALSNLEERMKMTAFKTLPEQDNADTFAHRAEAYYQKRPQLLSLLQDLYHAYLSLADRYCQTLAKQQQQHRDRQEDDSEISAFHFEDNHYMNEETVEDSDAESSLSYQPPLQFLGLKLNDCDHDNIVAELVIKSVDCEILLHELSVMDQRWSESSRKIELQKSLLEVLESERMILLNENARLGYRVSALVEENKGLASESLFMKRKAGELARCLLKMRDDQRACMLSRKIEDLQGQIYGLEKRNKEYYEQLVKTDHHGQHKHEEKEEEEEGIKGSEKKSKREVTLEDCCFYVDEEKDGVANNNGHVLMNKYCGKNANGNGPNGGGGSSGRGVYKWWDRLKNFDLFICGPHPNFTCC